MIFNFRRLCFLAIYLISCWVHADQYMNSSSSETKSWVFSGTPNGWGATPLFKSGKYFVTCQDFTTENPSFKIKNEIKGWSESFPEAYHVNYQVEQDKSYDIIFDSESHQIIARIRSQKCSSHTNVASSSLSIDKIWAFSSIPKNKSWVFSGALNGWGASPLRKSGKIFTTCQDFSDVDTRFKIRNENEGWNESFPKEPDQVEKNKSYDITFDPDSHQITAKPRSKLCPSASNTKNWVFSGTPNGWGTSPMTKSGELFVTCQDFTEENSRFKIRNEITCWNESFPLTNYLVEKNKSYDITFDPNSHEITANPRSTSCPPLTNSYIVEMEIRGNGCTFAPTLAKLILNSSKKENETIVFKHSVHNYTQDRDVAELQQNETVNRLLAIPTSKEREQYLLPIRIPIFKGIMGIRALVIRKEDEEKFSNITKLKDLETLKVGQGLSWTDTGILRKNNLPVTEGVNRDALYNMLKAKRIDYFPRGIIELFAEDQKISNLDLSIADNLLMYYPLPMYYFVNKKNTELANRIENGFKKMIKNGEFDKYFFNDPPIMAALEELKKHKHHVIRLKNIDLPEETPVGLPEYWFDLSPYEK